MPAYAATMKGSSEIGFTVLSMSASLVAVFIPILMLGGIVGRLFREFAVTLSVAIAVSMFVSLTTTPMLCARFLRHDVNKKTRPGLPDFRGRGQWNAQGLRPRATLGFEAAAADSLRDDSYCRTQRLHVRPRQQGIFSRSRTPGRIAGFIQADQDTSFVEMSKKMRAFSDIVAQDPAIDTVTSFTGGGNGTSTARMFAPVENPSMKRKMNADQVIARLRKKTAGIPGASLFFQSVQDVFRRRAFRRRAISVHAASGQPGGPVSLGADYHGAHAAGSGIAGH